MLSTCTIRDDQEEIDRRDEYSNPDYSNPEECLIRFKRLVIANTDNDQYAIQYMKYYRCVNKYLQNKRSGSIYSDIILWEDKEENQATIHILSHDRELNEMVTMMKHCLYKELTHLHDQIKYMLKLVNVEFETYTIIDARLKALKRKRAVHTLEKFVNGVILVRHLDNVRLDFAEVQSSLYDLIDSVDAYAQLEHLHKSDCDLHTMIDCMNQIHDTFKANQSSYRWNVRRKYRRLFKKCQKRIKARQIEIGHLSEESNDRNYYPLVSFNPIEEFENGTLQKNDLRQKLFQCIQRKPYRLAQYEVN